MKNCPLCSLNPAEHPDKTIDNLCFGHLEWWLEIAEKKILVLLGLSPNWKLEIRGVSLTATVTEDIT